MRSYHHRSAARILLTLAILVSFLPPKAHAAPEIGPAIAAAEQSVSAEITQPAASIAPDGTFRLNVNITVAAPTEYLEVRVRLRSPSGKLVYQKTEVRAGLNAGSHVITYEHEMAEADLKQGRHPIDVRVLATDADPTTLTGRLLVVDPDTSALPVAIVVVPTGVPYVTMAGTFSGDPSADMRLRDDLAYVTQLAADDDAPIALALPPILSEQLERVAAGYETTSGVKVPASDDTPVRYARMLDALRSAIATGTIEMVDVPYGLPDLAVLNSINGNSDIDLHWRQTDTVNALASFSAAGSNVAYLGRRLSAAGIASTDARGVACVLAHEGSLRSEDATAAPGWYTVGDTKAKVLIVDDAASAGAHEGPDAFYDALFERLDDGPAVVVLQIGPGAPHTTDDLRHVIDWLGAASWLRASDLASLTRSVKAKPATIVRPNDLADAEYWSSVATARSAALAYAQAVGPEDQDAAAATRALLSAESSLLAGVEQAQGIARSAEVLDYVTAQFDLVRLDAKDVTLSGSKGDVPLTLINDTGKQLNLELHTASGTRLSTVGSQDIVAQPTQNFITLPVDLGNALSDEIAVSVRVGDITVAEATVGVRASYIDRLATILMVVVVLAVLLVIIRRKVGNPVAGTIQADSHDTQRASREK